MKILFILRHAKSSWDDAQLSDFERPLNERGERVAPQMGEFMHAQKFAPDLIVSSPATRASETARLLKEAAGFTAQIKFDSKIYEASVGDLLRIIAQTDDAVAALMLVGHNPGLEDLITALTGEIHAFPTAALAEIELPIDVWEAIPSGNARLRNLFKPKELNIK